MIHDSLTSIGSPIYSEHEGELLGLLKDIIVSPETGKIEGLLIRPATLPIPEGVILMQDVRAWKKNIYIEGDRVISEPSDVIRIADIFQSGMYFQGALVQNEAGEYLGKIYNFDFDTRQLYLRNLYVHKSFLIFAWGERVFGYDTIIEVRPGIVVVKDDAKKAVLDSEIEPNVAA